MISFVRNLLFEVHGVGRGGAEQLWWWRRLCRPLWHVQRAAAGQVGSFWKFELTPQLIRIKIMVGEKCEPFLQTSVVRRPLWLNWFVRLWVPPPPRPLWGQDLRKWKMWKSHHYLKIDIRDVQKKSIKSTNPTWGRQSVSETLTDSKCLPDHFGRWAASNLLRLLHPI